MNKIICFDNWTAGAHHFERLVLPFEKYGYSLILIHVGSWDHDKEREKEELIGKLLVRDISYYNGKSLNRVLEEENPVAVLFLDTNSFPHMAFNRYASKLNIPTCLIYHGLVTVQAVGAGRLSPHKRNVMNALQIFRKRIFANLFIKVPIYIKSLIITSAPFGYWKSLVFGLLMKALNNDVSMGASITTSIGAVYTSSDIDHMNIKFQIPKDKIYVVGNPDLISFGLTSKQFLSNISNNNKVIIYIDTAYLPTGVVYKNEKNFLNHLKYTRDKLMLIGYSFVVKLHPAHFRTNIPMKLQDMKIKICKDDFVGNLNESCAVITEPSTAALIPALMGMPLLLANYKTLEGQEYGEVLKNYPRSIYLNNISEIKQLLNYESKHLDLNSLNKWISFNSGPTPAEDMPKRVVKAVDEMLNSI
jgi:hypothetical protein